MSRAPRQAPLHGALSLVRALSHEPRHGEPPPLKSPTGLADINLRSAGRSAPLSPDPVLENPLDMIHLFACQDQGDRRTLAYS